MSNMHKSYRKVLSKTVSGITTYIHVDVPVTKENFTFEDFLMDKYEDGFQVGYETAQEDGCRYHDRSAWINDLGADGIREEAELSGADLDKDLIEYNEFFTEI